MYNQQSWLERIFGSRLIHISCKRQCFFQRKETKIGGSVFPHPWTLFSIFYNFFFFFFFIVENFNFNCKIIFWNESNCGCSDCSIMLGGRSSCAFGVSCRARWVFNILSFISKRTIQRNLIFFFLFLKTFWKQKEKWLQSESNMIVITKWNWSEHQRTTRFFYYYCWFHQQSISIKRICSI